MSVSEASSIFLCHRLSLFNVMELNIAVPRMPRWLLWHKPLPQDACRERQVIIFSRYLDVSEDILSTAGTKK